eukprot:354869-Chlamydomonas_euryale.AAC.4
MAVPMNDFETARLKRIAENNARLGEDHPSHPNSTKKPTVMTSCRTCACMLYTAPRLGRPASAVRLAHSRARALTRVPAPSQPCPASCPATHPNSPTTSPRSGAGRRRHQGQAGVAHAAGQARIQLCQAGELPCRGGDPRRAL